jgi:hypothetical protein
MAVVPAIPTFTAGQIVTAAQLNQLGAALGFALNSRPVCKAHQTAAQSIPHVANPAITFNVTDVDTDLGRSGTGSGTDRYVCRTQGWYLVAATVSYVTNTTGARLAVIAVNGAFQNGYAGMPNAGSTNSGVSVSGLVHMNVNDYLQILAYQDSGVAVNTAVSPVYQACSLSIQFEIAG